MKKTKTAFLIIIFMICIIPSVLLLAGVKSVNYENRTLNKFPTNSNANDFGADFDAFFSDNFGLRSQFVTAFNELTVSLFGDTVNEKTVIGKDGWLFYSESLNDYLGVHMTDSEIARAATVIKLLSDGAHAQGVDFAFTIAPNKPSIYPEKMSSWYKKASNVKNLTLLKEKLDALHVSYIDLESVLIANKDKGLYYKTDTHWNDMGAMIAYRTIMGSIANHVKWNAYDEIKTDEANDYGGDVHYFIEPAVQGSDERVILDYETAYESAKPVNLERDVVDNTTSNTNDFKLLMFRDSFGKALFPLIASNVGQYTVSREFPYNYSDLDGETDAVLIELVERNIPWLITSAPNMTAVVRDYDGGAQLCLNAKAVVTKASGGAKVTGYFDPSKYDAETDTILFVIHQGDVQIAYEAFPILDSSLSSEAKDKYGNSASEGGFCLKLPAGFAGSCTAEVVIVKIDGSISSGNIIEFSL